MIMNHRFGVTMRFDSPGLSSLEPKLTDNLLSTFAVSSSVFKKGGFSVVFYVLVESI